MLATTRCRSRGNELTVDSSHQLVLAEEATGRTSCSRSSYSLTVRSDHEVIISMWSQGAGRNSEQIHVLSDHATRFW